MAIRLTGMASGLDTDSMVKELVSAYSTKLTSYEKQKTKLEWKQEAWKELNTKVYGFYSGSLDSLRRASAFTSKRNVTVSDSTKAKISAGSGAAAGTQTVEIKSLAKAAYLTGDEIHMSKVGAKADSSTTMGELGISGTKTLTFSIGKNTEDHLVVPKDVEIKDTDKISDVLEKIKNETGLSASFDKGTQRFILHAETGEKNDFAVSGDAADIMGLDVANGAQKQDGSDSKIIVNGATFISDSNTLNIGGLTIDALGVTDTALTINVSSDTDGIYNMVKSFFKDYNELINTMTKGYNAESAKDYEPLTDEEKDEMSDTEVEKWEKKIKDSLFRRDEQLQSIMSVLSNSIMSGIEIDGKTYHLSDFGIESMGITYSAENEQNAYHIDGDAEDKLTSSKADKLKELINTNPDLVQKFFNKLADKVHDSLHTKMTSTSLRSAYTVYNDKEMKNEMKNIKQNITDWEKKVKNYEDKWYDKFAQMEKAMTQLQAKTQSLTSLLGGSN